MNEAGSVVLSIENVSDITRFDPSQLERKQTKWLQGSDSESVTRNYDVYAFHNDVMIYDPNYDIITHDE